MKHVCYLQTPVGIIYIEENEKAITALYIDRECKGISDIKNGHQEENMFPNKMGFLKEPETELLRMAGTCLMEYFQGRRREFDLPLKPQGTEFQKKVWEALRQIPYGETKCYKEVAKQIGNPKACRAVGGANNKNPIMILIPCHRVIGANGALTGYAGGLEVKQYLLDLEKRGKVG